MHRQYLYGLSMIAGTLAWAGFSRADSPQVGHRMIATSAIVRDEKS
jgi:hypothetical protein